MFAEPDRSIKIGDVRRFTEHKVKDEFYITKNDLDQLRDKTTYRLMGCLNFRKSGKDFEFESTALKEYRKGGKSMLHWLPKQDNLVKAEVLMPDHTVEKGLASPLVKELKENDIVQFERFGFCRLDRKEKGKLGLMQAQ